MISLAHNTSHQHLWSERESAFLKDFGIESASGLNIIEKIALGWTTISSSGRSPKSDPSGRELRFHEGEIGRLKDCLSSEVVVAVC
jgi:hypothetical protein